MHAASLDHSMSNQIHYEALPEDHVALTRHLLKHSRDARRKHFASASGFAITWIVLVVLIGVIGGGTLPPFSWLVLAGILVLVIVAFATSLRTWRQLPEKNVRVSLKLGHGWNRLGPQTLDIAPDALHYVSQEEDTRLRWRGVYLIDDASGTLCFWDGPYSAFIIPARAFPSPQAMKDFAARAKEFKGAAPNYERECPVCRYDLREVPTEGCPECGWRRQKN
jgi:hypothetical protein